MAGKRKKISAAEKTKRRDRRRQRRQARLVKRPPESEA